MKLHRLLGLGALTISVSFGLVACGLVRESEQAPAVASLSTSAGSECEIPKLETLTDKDVSESVIHQVIDCAEKQVHQAFKSVHGKETGQISALEIKSLVDRGIITFPSGLQLSTEAWQGVGAVLSFFHPSGQPALSKAGMDRMISFFRKQVPLYRTWLGLDSDKPPSMQQYLNLIDVIDEFVSFISPRGNIKLSQAQALAVSLSHYIAHKKASGPVKSGHEIEAQTRALWILKSLVLSTEGHSKRDGPLGALTGTSLLKLLRLGIDTARATPELYDWGVIHDFLPEQIPKNLEFLGEVATRNIRDYFEHNEFSSIDGATMRWVALTLSTEQELVGDLMPDLIRISQRLAPQNRRRSGLHPLGLLKLLDATPFITSNLLELSTHFKGCTIFICSIKIRTALQAHPLLKKLAFKGSIYSGTRYWMDTNSAPPIFPRARRDYELDWESVMQRLIQLSALTQLYDTYDADHDGTIPMNGSNSKETKEALDLAYTFLRIASLMNQKDDSDPKSVKVSQKVWNPVMLKPQALSKLMGLMGDEWSTDGNGDQALDAFEFFGVVTLLTEIQTISLYSATSVWPPMSSDPDLPYYYSPGGAIYRRADFLTAFHEGYRYSAPPLHQLLVQMGPDFRNALMEALTPVAEEPIVAYAETWSTTGHREVTHETLADYVRSSAATAPAAILTLLDRLLIRCDLDEDEAFDWKELDCALPKVLKAAAYAIDTGALDLPPGVNDGGRVLLKFLAQPGMPLSLAKVVLLNGSIKNQDVLRQLETELDIGMQTDWLGIGELIGAPESGTRPQKKLWALEASQRYGKCDFNRDRQIVGQRELDCLLEEIYTSLDQLVSGFASNFVNEAAVRATLQSLREKQPLSKLAIKIAIQPEQRLAAAITRLPRSKVTLLEFLKIAEEIMRKNPTATSGSTFR